MTAKAAYFDGAGSKKNCPRKHLFSRHIKRGSKLPFPAACCFCYFIPFNCLRTSRITASARTFCVFLSLNMDSPFSNPILTALVTSKESASNRLLYALSVAARCISGIISAIRCDTICSAICAISRRCSSALPPCPSYVRRYSMLPLSDMYVLHAGFLNKYILFLPWVAGWVLGIAEKCISKISYPRPQHFLNYRIKGNCRSTSSMSCLMILYCSGKWISAACR